MTFDSLKHEARQAGLEAVQQDGGITLLSAGVALGQRLSLNDAEGLLYAYSEYTANRYLCANGACEVL